MSKKQTVLRHSTHLPPPEAQTLIMRLQHFRGAATTSRHSSMFQPAQLKVGLSGTLQGWACLCTWLLLFLSRRRKNEASHDRLSATLTPDTPLQSDNLLHTPAEQMVTAGSWWPSWSEVRSAQGLNIFPFESIRFTDCESLQTTLTQCCNEAKSLIYISLVSQQKEKSPSSCSES